MNRRIQLVEDLAQLLPTVTWGGDEYSRFCVERVVPLLEFTEHEKSLSPTLFSVEDALYQIIEQLSQLVDSSLSVHVPWAPKSPASLLQNLVKQTNKLENCILRSPLSPATQKNFFELVFKHQPAEAKQVWVSCFGRSEPKNTISFALLWIKLKACLPTGLHPNTQECWKQIAFRYLAASVDPKVDMSTFPITVSSFLRFYTIFYPVDSWYKQSESIVIAHKEFLWDEFGSVKDGPRCILAGAPTGSYLFQFTNENITAISLHMVVQYAVHQIPITVLPGDHSPSFMCDSNAFESLDEIVEHLQNYTMQPYDVSQYYGWFWKAKVRRSDVLVFFGSHAYPGQFAVVKLHEDDKKMSERFSLFYRAQEDTKELEIVKRNGKFVIDELNFHTSSLAELVWLGKQKGLWFQFLSTAEMYDEPQPPTFNARVSGGFKAGVVDGEVALRGGVVSRRHKKISSEDIRPVPPKVRKASKSTEIPGSPKLDNPRVTFTNFRAFAMQTVDEGENDSPQSDEEPPVQEVPEIGQNRYFGRVSIVQNANGLYSGFISLPTGVLQRADDYSIQLTPVGTFLNLIVQNVDAESSRIYIQGLAINDPRISPNNSTHVQVYYSVFIVQ